jgi:hypothetical protein
VLLIGQAIGRQRHATAGPHREPTLLAQGTEHALEGQRGDGKKGRTPCETEATVGGDQGVARHSGTHAARAPDAVGQHRQDRRARGALSAPEGEPAQSNPRIMGVSGQTPTTEAGRLVCELQAQGEEQGEDACDQGPAIVHQRQGGGWLLELARDGTVVAGRLSALFHVSSSVARAVGADETLCGERVERARVLCKAQGITTQSGGVWPTLLLS